ncbi:MAG: ATP-binding protein [Candidatus Beckwithbacteria bacterium]|nr:ATP-binding protein [Patescibacteria group bacterium]
MIPRLLSSSIKKSAKSTPIIGLLGPRQSGKTTLAKSLFPKYAYVNLELPDNLRFATEDPRGFLKRYSKYVIIDEVQRAPELFSYLQVKTDKDKINGQYILTGSQHFLLLDSITQSLAGRISIFNLYPFSYQELKNSHLNQKDLYKQIWLGGYPRIYNQKTNPIEWLNNYIKTYLERDVSLISKIDSLPTFDRFLRLAAGRTGQLLSLSSLASDVGVTHNTIKSWINLLEISGLIKLLQPYFKNLNKRLTKTPKLYFLDTGLACRLLGINSAKELSLHSQLGALFETWIISETYKSLANDNNPTTPYFWRDRTGLEADLLLEFSLKINLYEIKSAQTIHQHPFKKLTLIKNYLQKTSHLNLIYGGDDSQSRSNGEIFSWQDFITHLSKLR